jgi:hypothetical protein
MISGHFFIVMVIAGIFLIVQYVMLFLLTVTVYESVVMSNSSAPSVVCFLRLADLPSISRLLVMVSFE